MEHYSKDIQWLLKNILKAGLIFERRISKIGNSGCVYVHKDLAGRMARIIVIPLEEKQGIVKSRTNEETKIGNFDTEKWKKDMTDTIENLRKRIYELENDEVKEEMSEPKEEGRFKIDT